jgi:murein DD-endopeptidase MepM/ murein hydrolase activator NlpD
MLICPIQNKAAFVLNWIQIRPKVSQIFNEKDTRHWYEAMGMTGHNGIDWGIPVGTPIFAPMDGQVKVKDSGKDGYGLHFKIRNPYKASEFVGGHMSDIIQPNGSHVHSGDLMGYSGNTGFSTAPHFHGGYRLLKDSDKDIFSWEVMDYSNGFFGYIDFLEYVLNWKGTHKKFTL